MNYYAIALFLHIVGALGFFVALGLEWANLRHLQRATSAEQVRTWMSVLASERWLGGVSLVLLLLAGFYMTATVWRGVAWIAVALGALILLAVLAAVLSRPRMAAIGRAVATENGLLSASLYQQLHHPLLWVSIQTRVAIALGIVYLMTVKPDLNGSLLTISVAAVLGLVSALPALAANRARYLSGRSGGGAASPAAPGNE